jgi:hypothetical protein
VSKFAGFAGFDRSGKTVKDRMRAETEYRRISIGSERLRDGIFRSRSAKLEKAGRPGGESGSSATMEG